MAKTHYCFLKKFNNYFNRKIIRYDTLAEYQTASEDDYIPLNSQNAMQSFDFNPNDNVTTEIIADEVPFSPDYFLELDDDEEILSRWFVMEMKRNRQGQWLYSLKRDVISDNVESLLNSPIFVQKGVVGDDNPLILNSEGMNFNQIKTQETLLKDATRTSWLIGYIAKSAGGSDINIQVPTEDIEDAVNLSQIATDLGTTEAILSGLLNFDGMNTYPTRFISGFGIAYHEVAGIIYGQQAYWYDTSWSNPSIRNYSSVSVSYPLFALSDAGYSSALESAFKSAIHNNKTALNSDILNLIHQDYYFKKSTEYVKLKAYEGRYVHYLGKYYKLHIVESGTNNITHDSNFAYTRYTSLQTIATVTGSAPNISLRSNGRYDYFISYGIRVYIQMQEITDDNIIPQAETKISSNRKVTLDQQFDMIALPAGPITLYTDNNGVAIPYENNGDITRRILSQLALDEDAKVYDIQLLPYCPIPSLLTSAGRHLSGTEGEDYDFITVNSSYLSVNVTPRDGLNVVVTEITNTTHDVTATFGVQTESGKTVTIDDISISDQQDESVVFSNITASINDSTGILTISYRATAPSDMEDPESVYFLVQYHYAGESKVGTIFYCSSATFQTILNYKLSLKDSMKIDSQCDMYRLLSPNYQGTFEFNVAKNGGSVDFFTAYCTYKPYTPFIKVCPSFSFVYGMDYNDNRGLICGGDFSLPRISSAWQSYQLNNKNFQNIFNRDIQNLDLMQSLEARQQYISGGIGIGTDSMKGAISGAMVGGGWGAVAGGVIGAGMSAVGYGIDVDIMAKQHQEARSYAVDKYNFQLGNIKALPYTLTKVGAFDISSKIFPVLEYYTCSEEEKEALRKKIQYESMTVMAIGLFGDYYRAFDELKYFKGELIRCDAIADDTHILDAIYTELLKGVYM